MRAADARIGRPVDARHLTPADTSSTVRPTLASALRRRQPGVEEILLPATPGGRDRRSRRAAGSLRPVVVGTFAAHSSRRRPLAAAVLASGKPTVTVALRTPWDLLAYPSARTHVCSYGILPPSMEALAAALWARRRSPAACPSRSPVCIPAVTGSIAWG